MAKEERVSPIVQEVKKEYLKEHLDDVKDLIRKWLPELKAPAPLDEQDGHWGWQSVYRASLEQDLDNNHILRRHLRSRTLWHHHATWERYLDNIWDLANGVRKQAYEYAERAKKVQWQYDEVFLNTAAWRGFEEAAQKEIERPYNDLMTAGGFAMRPTRLKRQP
jgi:hypothetical protein